MGVSGSGKTTIGKQVAYELALPFYDADDFHPEENINKMSKGIPLNDEDRLPWLNHLASHFKEWESIGGVVLACSALKESYRQLLMSKGNEVEWIYLAGTKDEIHARMNHRKKHYMKAEMLDSQFEALEEPAYGLRVDTSNDTETIVKTVIQKLNR